MQLSRMPVEALHSLLLSLLEQIPEDTSPRVIVVKPDLPAPTPVRPNGNKSRQNAPEYDPRIVFVLELATILALRDSESVEAIGKEVADVLQSVVRDASKFHYVVVSRAVYYLLSLLRATAVSINHLSIDRCHTN